MKVYFEEEDGKYQGKKVHFIRAYYKIGAGGAIQKKVDNPEMREVIKTEVKEVVENKVISDVLEKFEEGYQGKIRTQGLMAKVYVTPLSSDSFLVIHPKKLGSILTKKTFEMKK